MSAAKLNLSGEWAGVYSYPNGLPPVAFTASLKERAGRIAGVIAEDGLQGEGLPRRRHAEVEGRRVGQGVHWLKTYAHRDVAHDVDYEGAVSADGKEISGRWSIFADWAGAFLMVRQPRRRGAREAGDVAGLRQAT